MKEVKLEVINHTDEEMRIFRPVDPAHPVDENGEQGSEVIIPARGSQVFKGPGRVFLDASLLGQPGPGHTTDETSSGGD